MPPLVGAVSLRAPYATRGPGGAVGGVPSETTRCKSSPGRTNTLGNGEARIKVGAWDELVDMRAAGGFKTAGGGFTVACGRGHAATLPVSGGRGLCGGG